MPPKRTTRASASASGPTSKSPHKQNIKKPSKRALRAAATTSQNRTRKSARRRQGSPELVTAYRLFAVPAPEEAAADLDDDLDEEDEDYEDDDDTGERKRTAIPVRDVKRALASVDLPPPPANFFERGQRYVSRSDFLALARTTRDALDSEKDEDYEMEDADAEGEDGDEGEQGEGGDAQTVEVDAAFALFKGNGRDGRITIADLRRIARELREEVDDSTLQLMMEEANGGTGDEAVAMGVGREEFEGIMRRAGVFT